MTSEFSHSVASSPGYTDIQFEDAGRIDDLWKFDRTHSEHRDRARQDFEQLIENNPQYRLMFLPLTPFIIAPTGKANYVLPQQLPLTCYRGQSNAEWGLLPSICRADVDGETGIFRDLVNEMRIQEFGKMMANTARYRRWTSLELGSPDSGVTMAKGLFFDYRSLAQHFFVPTERLDLTNDVEVALFFACTKHVGGGRYEPLSSDDIRECDQGSIFISLLLNSSMQDDFKGVSIIPVQPYVRPAMQSGFSFIPGNLDTDLGISRFVFNHDPDFSDYICEKFENGDKLFEEKGTEWVSGQVNSILDSHTFSSAAYTRACRFLGVNHKDERRLLKELESHGNYEIGRNAHSMSDISIAGLEPDWDMFGYMNEIGMDTSLPTIKTAYGNEDGRFFYTNDRPIAGMLGMMRSRYAMMFKTV